MAICGRESHATHGIQWIYGQVLNVINSSLELYSPKNFKDIQWFDTETII